MTSSNTTIIDKLLQYILHIPVAATGPIANNEVLIASRAKRRPALIVSGGGREIDKKLNPNKPRWQTNPMLIIAPYYGVDEGKGFRAGFSQRFVERVKQCMYPQFLWDRLPIGTETHESILKLDHIQAVGRHHESIELTEYRLSEEALIIFDEYLEWLVTGRVISDST